MPDLPRPPGDQPHHPAVPATPDQVAVRRGRRHGPGPVRAMGPYPAPTARVRPVPGTLPLPGLHLTGPVPPTPEPVQDRQPSGGSPVAELTRPPQGRPAAPGDLRRREGIPRLVRHCGAGHAARAGQPPLPARAAAGRDPVGPACPRPVRTTLRMDHQRHQESRQILLARQHHVPDGPARRRLQRPDPQADGLRSPQDHPGDHQRPALRLLQPLRHQGRRLPGNRSLRTTLQERPEQLRHHRRFPAVAA